MPFSVIHQQVTDRRYAILLGHTAAAHKQVQVSVAIHIVGGCNGHINIIGRK